MGNLNNKFYLYCKKSPPALVEENKFKNGDKVSIRECKPFSKSKKFEVIGGAK